MKVVLEYSVYRTKVLLFALVDQVINNMWDGVKSQDGDAALEWPTHLADWIRTKPFRAGPRRSSLHFRKIWSRRRVRQQL